MKKQIKVPVSSRAVAVRISRKIAKEGKTFTKFKEGTTNAKTFGKYAVIDKAEGRIIDKFDSLESAARKFDCLKGYEQID